MLYVALLPVLLAELPCGAAAAIIVAALRGIYAKAEGCGGNSEL